MDKLGLLAFCWLTPFKQNKVPLAVLCNLKLDELGAAWLPLMWYAYSASLVFGTDDIYAVLLAKFSLAFLCKAKANLRVAASGLLALSSIAFMREYHLGFHAMIALWFSLKLLQVSVFQVKIDPAKDRKHARKKLRLY